MQITEDKWNAIVAEARQGIDKWNTNAAERKLSDSFHCELLPAGEYVLLLTTHATGGEYSQLDRKAVAYKPATREMKPAKPVVKKGRMTGFQTKSDPKAWATFADKPAAEIVKQLRLTDFLVVLGARVVRPPSGPPLYHVQGWHRDSGRRVAMIVAEEEGMLSAHGIAERIAGPDYIFNSSSNIGVLVPPKHQGVLFEQEQLYALVPELKPRDFRRRTNPSPSAA